MFSKKIEGESIDKNNKYANLTKPRTSPLDFSSPIPTKKNHSINEKNNYSISVINKLKNLNNSFSIEQENNNNNSMSYQSDSNIKYNNAPSTSSSLVDKMFITQTASKKIHFNPNDFSNPDSSFYVNSDSILKSNMSISSVDSLNENYNIKTKRDSKKIDNSEYIRKIEEENSKLEDEINKLKEEFKKINNILQKNKIHVEEIEQSNKLEIENLNNEIEKKNKVINQLKDKNEYLLNEVQEKKESIEEYKILNQSLKKDKNNYESKFKNSEVIIQNLKEENAKINEENFELKEQIEILSDISIEKEKLANENEHLRQIAEELDIKNENTINEMKSDYSGKPTLMDEIQSEISSSDQDRNQIENVLRSKLRTSQFENRDLKEEIKLLKKELEELHQIKEKENSKLELTSNEKINDIIKKAKEESKLEVIKKYKEKEKDLIQEIEQQKLVINQLNNNEDCISKNYDKSIAKFSIDKNSVFLIISKHKIQFSLLFILTWLLGVLICFIAVEYVVYLAGDYGICHHLSNQLFFPQAVMQALSSKSSIPL